MNSLIGENVVRSAEAKGTDLKLIETSDWRASGFLVSVFSSHVAQT